MTIEYDGHEEARHLASYIVDKMAYELMDDCPTYEQLYSWIATFKELP